MILPNQGGQRRNDSSAGTGGKWILIGVAAVSLLLLWAGLSTTAHNRARETQSQIHQRLQAIKAAGEPLTEADLLRMFPDPAPEHDAERLLKDALSRLAIPEHPTNLPFFDETPLPHSGPLAAALKAEIVKCLNDNRAALATISWDQLETAWVSSGLAGGFANNTRSAISPVLDLIKLLCLKAVLAADDNAPGDSAQSLLRALTIARTMRDDIPIHHLANACSQIVVCDSLERILNRASLSNEDLQRLQAGLTLTNLAAVKQDVLFSRCFGIFIARFSKSLASQPNSSGTAPLAKLARAYETRIIYQDTDLLQFLGWADQCLAALDMPLSNAVFRLHAIEARNQQRHVSVLDGIRRRGPSLVSTFEPAVSQFLLREAEAVARVRITIVALAAERWRLGHAGNLPEKLSDLVPAYLPVQPLDPFDNSQIRYARRTEDCVIYSVGPDFTDDGGKERAPNQSESAHYDITFALRRF